MFRKLLMFLLVLSLINVQSILAQDSTISGQITDEKEGIPLPGVNVIVKGTSIGVLSDFNGNYSIKVPSQGTVLVFSSLGFSSKEIIVADQSVINVVLMQELEKLDEVVVTALNIKRNQKTLGYSITQLKSDAIAKVKTTNAINSLQGKIAGVNITQPSTGTAGTSRVIIRGASGLTSDNQPLYVVDGVTIDNTQLGAASEWGGSDFGDGISSLNPDDVASINVLKGGAAAALYGSRASGGVILITTKNGKGQKGLGVEYSTQVNFDQLNDLRDFQREYGQGLFGIAPEDQGQGIGRFLFSWGPRLGSLPTSIQFDGVERPYTDVGDNLRRFYKTGITLINTVALSKSGKDYNLRFAVSNLDNQDIVPNSKLNRKTFSINSNFKVANKLTSDISARYVIERVNNRPRVSDSPGNSNFVTALIPANVNVLDIGSTTGGATEDGTEIPIAGAFTTNPYWAANHFTTFDRRNRLISAASINYEIFKWLNITARAGIDHNTTRSTRIEGFGTAFIPRGQIEENQVSITQVDADLLVNINKNITKKIGVDATFGINKNTQRSDRLQSSGRDFVIPFVETLGNATRETRDSFRRLDELALSGIYGTVGFSYDDYLFLTVTGRNDWFSTLSAAGKTTPNNDFYPSVSGSFVFTDAMEMPTWFSFGKIRAGYSEVAGGAPAPYSLSLPFQISGSHLGQGFGGISTNTVPNGSITPFSKEETEIGLDFRFFRGRLGFDVAYYTNSTKRDIVNVNISSASGFQNIASNIGELENNGIEFLVTGTPFQNTNFKWDTSFNLGYNDSEIVATNENNDNLLVGQARTQQAEISHIVGEPFGTILGTAYLRNDAGQIVYDVDGNPVTDPERQILGQGVAPYTLGFTNNFKYKNFNLSFLIDAKFGGDIYSGTDRFATRLGLHKNTLAGRNEANPLVVSGVDEAGAPFEFTHQDPTGGLLYHVANADIAESSIYSADFIKFREFTLGYTFSSQILQKTFLTAANISIVGRNLFFLKRDSGNIDPEAGINAGNAQGIEYFGLPTTRSYGFSANFKF
ncbi:SusC/RagA family TonB-linked outer membrane protein [Aquimarina sp. RZ0]|uniref:SusC/RagA family TonB-linked outer membrane protein n=1 Tax=Aquimarina sp. RZ0 TaxID=2607730 RepID=UPI0011F0EBE8|nr:SusC/RagA family TonB-linked outer membrane protein [Aquimarina sp. RZ0]KAA1243025.1 SusC/RagA family TonB-linked outer membrane protein [Aquimarina sp. RZ0]